MDNEAGEEAEEVDAEVVATGAVEEDMAVLVAVAMEVMVVVEGMAVLGERLRRRNRCNNNGVI